MRKGQIFKASLIFLVAMSLPVHAEERSDWPADCKLERVAQLPMTLISGHVTIPASANGKDLTLGIDTGGPFSSLTMAGADRLGLGAKVPFPGSRFVNSNAKDGVKWYDEGAVHLDNLRIGDLKLDSLRIQVLEAFPGVDGLIAPDILGHYDLEFDFGGKTFSLYKPHRCSDDAVTWTGAYVVIPFDFTRGRHIRVPVTLDGQNTHAIVDTGAGISVLSMRDANSMFGLAPNTPDVETTNPVLGPWNRPVQAYTYAFKTLTIGGMTIQGPRIVLTDGSNFLEHDYATLVLGTDVLSRFHLYIAYRQQKLYITDAQAH